MAETEVLKAPNVIEYPFSRTTGPVIGAFFTALREGFIVGVRGADGRVIVPPFEYDPITAEDLTEIVEVGDAGEVTTWAWINQPLDDQPVQAGIEAGLDRMGVEDEDVHQPAFCSPLNKKVRPER